MMNETYPANSEWARDDRATEMQVATLARVYTIRHGLIFRPDRIRPMFMPASELAHLER